MKTLLGLFLFGGLILSGCSNNASHLPTIVDIPSMVGGVFENANYNAKRKRVGAYVAKHYLSMRSDAEKGGGASLEGVFDVAGIRSSKRVIARNRIIQDKKYTFYNALVASDALINVFSALYVNQSSPRDKRINGFTYIDAKMLIQAYAKSNFEKLRVAIQQGQGAGLDQLLNRLNVRDAQKQAIFKAKAQNLYYRIYLEPVIVAIMVNTN